MKHIQHLLLVFALGFVTKASAQFYEVKFTFSDVFENVASMNDTIFTSKFVQLADGSCLAAFVDSIQHLIVARSGNVLSWLMETGDPDALAFTKVTLQGDTLEHIIFYINGRVTSFQQCNKSQGWCTVPGYTGTTWLEDYISQNLCGYHWNTHRRKKHSCLRASVFFSKIQRNMIECSHDA